MKTTNAIHLNNAAKLSNQWGPPLSQQKPTLGQAIDQIVAALEPMESSDRKTALAAVCAHLGVTMDNVHLESQQGPDTKTPSQGQNAESNAASPPRKTPSVTPITDIRSLKEEKKPSSAKEMACLVAFYVQEYAPGDEKKESISTADLEKYFKQAGFKLPQKIRQVLPDAKGSGYFDSAGRGEYKLNAVGYNLVAHTLPKSSGDA